MQVFDASSMIYAWDNYPERQFPPLWDWIATQIGQHNLVMPTVAFEEVENKDPDCGAWLGDKNLQLLPMNNPILQDAMRIKGLIGVVDDNYHPDGVGENDLFIIATARAHRAELVTDERKQPNLPIEFRRYKIPAVCGISSVVVPCINFIEYIKRSNEIFR